MDRFDEDKGQSTFLTRYSHLGSIGKGQSIKFLLQGAEKDVPTFNQEFINSPLQVKTNLK